jgi:hypothetical protein
MDSLIKRDFKKLVNDFGIEPGSFSLIPTGNDDYYILPCIRPGDRVAALVRKFFPLKVINTPYSGGCFCLQRTVIDNSFFTIRKNEKVTFIKYNAMFLYSPIQQTGQIVEQASSTIEAG